MQVRTWSLVLHSCLAVSICACGGGDATEERVEAASPGAFVPLGTDVAVQEAPDGARAPKAAPEAESDVVKPVDLPPAPPAPPSASEPSAARASPSEIELCAWLARDRSEFRARLARVEGLSPGRRAWLEALAHAIDGDVAASSAALAKARADGGAEQAELEFVARLCDAKGAIDASSRSSPFATAAWVAGVVAEGARAARSGDHAQAARSFTSALLHELSAPWPTSRDNLAAWTAELRAAQRKHRWNKAGSWAARTIEVQRGDNLIAIRKRALSEDPALLVSTGLLARVNELQGETIHPGQKLRVPVDRARMLVDLDAHWAFFLLGDEIAEGWLVGVGHENSTTPAGAYTVGEKTREPMWFRKGAEPVAFDDPRNPLGTRWIEWLGPEGTETHLGFHGTNAPETIGGDQSQGCIRMRNEDVETLYEILPKGAVVIVQP